jgi:hypothetical protein
LVAGRLDGFLGDAAAWGLVAMAALLTRRSSLPSAAEAEQRRYSQLGRRWQFPLRNLAAVALAAGTWVAAVYGRIVDTRGDGVEGAFAQHCLRLHDGRFVCTAPAMSLASGWYVQVFDEELRCVDEIAIRASKPGAGFSTTYCHIPLEPDDGVQLLPHPAALLDVAPPAALPPVGDPAAPRDVAFEGGVTLTGVVPDELFGGDYEDLAGSSVPLTPAIDYRPCFLGEGEELLGLYAFAPEVEPLTPVGLRVPNDAELPDGTKVTLYALGGLATLRPDGTQIEEADFEAFGTATVQGDAIVSDEDVRMPALTWFGWRAAAEP